MSQGQFGQDPSIVLSAIEADLARRGVAPSTFGREAWNDPRFVFDLRKGRTITAKRLRRIHAYLNALEAANA